MIIDHIINVAPSGTVIPKPNAVGRFHVLRMGRRRGERALIYSIPNNNNQNNPYEKGITEMELERSYRQLLGTGELSRKWFRNNLPACEAEGSCNFTTVGGLFILLNIATYAKKGLYKAIP